MNILEIAFNFVTKPKHSKQMGNSLNWIGKIKTNKNITLFIYGASGEKYKKDIKEKVPTLVTFTELCELEMKSIQEGPEEGRVKYNAKGNARVANPLIVSLVDDIDKNSSIIIEDNKTKKQEKIKQIKEIPRL